jgi:hypothetical protein
MLQEWGTRGNTIDVAIVRDQSESAETGFVVGNADSVARAARMWCGPYIQKRKARLQLTRACVRRGLPVVDIDVR